MNFGVPCINLNVISSRFPSEQLHVIGRDDTADRFNRCILLMFRSIYLYTPSLKGLDHESRHLAEKG